MNSTHEIQDTLERFFHLQEFRPNQQEIIQSIVNGRDVLAVMATGGGKSLCYQLPAMVLPGLTVVISPLIALMKDQVDSLLTQGVRAAMLNSSLSSDKQQKVEADIISGKIRLLYVSPERAVIPGFVDVLQQTKVSLFAVDEAHCISMWGHQFRPVYRSIKGLRAFFPGVPFAAFTATASRRVREDIISQLKMNNPAVFIGDFDRPNLRYVAIKEPRHEMRIKRIAGCVAARPRMPGIIYCFTRADTEEMAVALQRLNITAAAYHAGMSTRNRSKVQEMFQSNTISVVCATIAFGMGIDKPDVRYVIHAHLPRDLESYYQETGRAGRDGKPAECILFYSAGDRTKMLKLAEKEAEEPGNNTNIDGIRARMQQLYAYCEEKGCRRKMLLGYFDQVLQNDCGNCDNCLKIPNMPACSRKTGAKAANIPAGVVKEILFAVGEIEGMLTTQEFVSFLMGMERAKTRTLGLRRHACFGVLKYYTRGAVEGLVEKMIAEGKIRLTGKTVMRICSAKQS